MRTLPAAAAIVALTLAAYLPALGAGYIWDDDSYLTANPLVQSADGLARIWVPGYTPQYYPMVFTSFWIEHALWGLKPLGYHLVNVLLHAANALLVWRLMTRLGVRGAWLIGAVFALHPVAVESVAWITERKNVLSACFYLTAALAYLRFDDRREWGSYGAALLLYAAALLSKSVTCSLPAALVLVMLYRREPLTWRRLTPLAPMLVIGLLAAANTVLMERLAVGAAGPEWDLGLADRVLIAARALLFYPAKLLWPHPLMFIYPRWAVDPGDWLSWWRPMLVLAVVAAVLLAWVRGIRGPFVALAFYAGTVFPALGFFNLYPHRFSFVADHFAYLAGLGVIALVVSGVTRLVPPRRSLQVGAAAALLLVLGVLSFSQARTYRDAESVWMDTLAKNPDSWMPHTHMAVIRLAQLGAIDRDSEPDRWRRVLADAEQHAQRAVALNPGDPQVLGKLSETLRLEGRLDEAVELQTTVVRLLSERHGDDDAWPVHDAEELVKLARIHNARGELEQAEAAYRRAVRVNPTFAAALYELASLLAAQDRLDESIEQLDQLLNEHPQHLEALLAMTQIAARRLAEAEAYAAAGDVDDAIAAATQALDLARRVHADALADQITRTLDGYRAAGGGDS